MLSCKHEPRQARKKKQRTLPQNLNDPCFYFVAAYTKGDLTEFGFGFTPDNRRVPGQQYFQTCVVGGSLDAISDAFVGPAGALAGAATGCATNVGVEAVKDLGVDEDVANNIGLGIDIATGGLDVARWSLSRVVRGYSR